MISFSILNRVLLKTPLRLIFLLFFVYSLWPIPTQAQTSLQRSFFDDSVTVSVSNISIGNQFSLRGLTADFPYPVLSTISVVDSRGNPIFGLADTSRWLGPEDVAQIGLPISEIWQPILEYHRDAPAFPPDPNVFNQSPPPLFTEVVETGFLPTSTMLVMDVSGSMVEEIDDTKSGARLFVDLLQSPYQVGIVQFSDSRRVIALIYSQD